MKELNTTMENEALTQKKKGASGISLKTRQITACGILCALSTVFMIIGAITDVLDLTMMMLASLLVAFAVIEIGNGWAWLIWGVTSVICLLLLPSKTIALFYFLGGMYPIAKSGFEKVHFIFSWLLKFSMFNTVQLLYFVAAKYILNIPDAAKNFMIADIIFNNFVFLMYDIAMTLFISFYIIRLRKRLHIPDLRERNRYDA